MIRGWSHFLISKWMIQRTVSWLLTLNTVLLDTSCHSLPANVLPCSRFQTHPVLALGQVLHCLIKHWWFAHFGFWWLIPFKDTVFYLVFTGGWGEPKDSYQADSPVFTFPWFCWKRGRQRTFFFQYNYSIRDGNAWGSEYSNPRLLTTDNKVDTSVA